MMQFQQLHQHQIKVNPFGYGNLRRVQPALRHLIDFITVQHQVGCESVMLVKKDVLVLNGQKLVQGMQVHKQLMLQIMSECIAAHHLLCLFVQLAIDKNQRLIKIRALFEGEQRVEESQLKCEGVGQTKVSVSYHAVAEDWGEMADSEINVLDRFIEKEALHAMMAVLTKKQRNLIYQNYVLDKTHQEIADGMGIARGSVTRSVNQALERIRRKFDFEAHYELAVGDFT
ncbi:MAG TPA: sigma-70 family RNA polymerase sigma factor [Faecalibacterium prausnitzii]|nr:sigma-70 family RNA polymerase sigma factor [Faecalibacterium prausnitzii]